MKVKELLLKAVRDGAANYDPEIKIAPACVLWPDRDRQWEAVIPLLQAELPELLILGDYTPEKRTGPAIWLRCVIAGFAEDVSLPRDIAPIFYLPGVSRQDLRAVESCPDFLKPLAELQYRGIIWSQSNSKDWTILAYLKSDQGGLGLDVAQDNDAKNAMQLALYRLLNEDLGSLKGRRLNKDYFNSLLAGSDPTRDLLEWLDKDDTFQSDRDENEWKAFVEVCKSQLAFDPQKESVLACASKLATHEGPWRTVWNRFCEAPIRYPNIPTLIRRCRAPLFDLFADETTAGGWPQWNEEQEKTLRLSLTALDELPTSDARKKIKELEKLHGRRRSLVWAELGEAPLACALEHLAAIAEYTKTSLAAGTANDLADGYCNQGWKADDGVVRALVHVENNLDFEAVKTAIRSVYLPWAEDSARHLQKIVDEDSYPGGTYLTAKPVTASAGECLLFIDGLRFDVGKRLTGMLASSGFEVSEEPVWTALPSVTATGESRCYPGM